MAWTKAVQPSKTQIAAAERREIVAHGDSRGKRWEDL